MFRKHWHFFIALAIFLALLLRDPFSQRTLIPNLEPYPDTIHYINSARSFIEGYGLQIYREGRMLKMSVPPLYSVILIPLFSIHNDVRMFYFTNVILALLSFWLFYKILRKLLSTNDHRLMLAPRSLGEVGTNDLIIFITLFLYVTNYFFYWYPSLAMAENLTLFLFLSNLYLMVVPLNKFTIILGAVIPFCFFLTKYANIPLTASFLLMFGIKLLLENRKGKNKLLVNNLIVFGGSIFAMFIVMVFTESFPGTGSLKALFGNMIPQVATKTQVSSGGGWFSIQYMKDFLPKYIRALFGGYSVHFLWDTTPILPIYIAPFGIIGLLVALFSNKTRLFAATLLIALLSSILFMSTFYSIDMRYIYHAIPTLLIGFALFWKMMATHKVPSSMRIHLPFFNAKNRNSNVLCIILLFILFMFYSVTNAVRLKKQIMLNIKYAETPWYYISVLKLNEYFKNYPKSKKEPVVISAMIPYYIDFYSNGEYALLPMSHSQEFRTQKDAAWGTFDYTDLIMLYTKILYSGHEVFVHNYGIGNEKPLQEDFKKIQDNFILTKVKDGCYDACNIWKLEIKYPLMRKVELK